MRRIRISLGSRNPVPQLSHCLSHQEQLMLHLLMNYKYRRTWMSTIFKILEITCFILLIIISIYILNGPLHHLCSSLLGIIGGIIGITDYCNYKRFRQRWLQKYVLEHGLRANKCLMCDHGLHDTPDEAERCLACGAAIAAVEPNANSSRITSE